MPEVALILLAAGAATRMGAPKQLLDYAGRPLIRHCTEVALASRCRPIIVVLGAESDRIAPVLADLPVQVVRNPRWAEGVGTSIQAGLRVLETDLVDAVVLALADQPLVRADTLDALVDEHRARGSSLVASAYDGTVGVPALFGRARFPELLALGPDQGCKGILLRHGAEVVTRPCPEAALDLDTPADFARLSAAGRTGPPPTTPASLSP